MVEGKRHYRVNLRLLAEDTFNGKAILDRGRLKLFRPTPHGSGG